MKERAALEPRLGKLRDVKLIGLGGVGSIVARYASIYLAALDHPTRLVLIDGDDFEPKNATRMIFPFDGNKAAVLGEEIGEHVGDSRLSVQSIEQYVDAQNLPRLIREGDLASWRSTTTPRASWSPITARSWTMCA